MGMLGNSAGCDVSKEEEVPVEGGSTTRVAPSLTIRLNRRLGTVQKPGFQKISMFFELCFLGWPKKRQEGF